MTTKDKTWIIEHDVYHYKKIDISLNGKVVIERVKTEFYCNEKEINKILSLFKPEVNAKILN